MHAGLTLVPSCSCGVRDQTAWLPLLRPNQLPARLEALADALLICPTTEQVGLAVADAALFQPGLACRWCPTTWVRTSLHELAASSSAQLSAHAYNLMHLRFPTGSWRARALPERCSTGAFTVSPNPRFVRAGPVFSWHVRQGGSGQAWVLRADGFDPDDQRVVADFAQRHGAAGLTLASEVQRVENLTMIEAFRLAHDALR